MTSALTQKPGFGKGYHSKNVLTADDLGTISPKPIVVNVMKMKYNAVPKSQPSRAQYINDMTARKTKMIGKATHTGALICASADSNS